MILQLANHPSPITAMLAIDYQPLPYEERLEARASSAIDLVVIHCTELPDMAMAREYGERIHYPARQTGNSGHYYIDLAGKVFRYVSDERVANHTYGYNTRSIGIELVNIGRYPHWGDSRYQAFSVPYTAEQIASLRALLAQLRNDHANLHWIAGHEDLDRRLEPAKDDPAIQLRRRQDPGPLFPWDEVMQDSGLERLTPSP
jgi:N-acetylmuramoyl-L-alanine amidase